MQTIHLLLVALISVVGDTDNNPIKITDQRGCDSVEIIQEQGATVIVLTSKVGIGSATIKSDKAWPMKLSVRLKYANDQAWKSLEGFSVSNQRATLSTSLRGELEIRPLSDQSIADKLAMKVNVSGTACDVLLPIGWLGEEDEFTIRFVDFYRN